MNLKRAELLLVVRETLAEMLLFACFSLAVGSISVLYVVNYLVEYLRYLRLLSKLPEPKPLPVIGHLSKLVCDRNIVFGQMREWSQQYGPIYRLRVFNSSAVNISGAEEFEILAATSKHIEKSTVYNFIRRWLGEGLLTSTGSKWQTRRKILTPAFHFNILQKFVAVFHSRTDKLIDALRKEVNEPWTDVCPIISQFTLDTIAETSMGIKLNVANKDDREYIRNIHDMGPMIFHRMLRPWLFQNFIYYNATINGFRERILTNTLHKFTNSIIAEKVKNFEIFEKADGEYNYAQRKKLAFLDLMLNAKISEGIIDEEGIRDEVNTFMFGGYDTTSTSLCFTLMLLALHRNWQNSIYEEITQILGKSREHPSLNELNQMKLMERFIKESLRLYPSVPFIGRLLEEDTLMNGYLLPKSAEMHIHIYDIHRNPKYWQDPEKFDPDRFLPENCVNRHPFAYVPFSAGPRNCIGQKFAMVEMKTALCGILRNFVLEPKDTPETITIIPDIVLRTADYKLRVKFKSRQLAK